MGSAVRMTEEQLAEIKKRQERWKKPPRCAARGPAKAGTSSQRPTQGQSKDPEPAAAKVSAIVRRFEQQLSAHVFPPYEREYYAIPGREHRFDYAFVKQRVLVEIQGQQHRIKGRFKDDIEKRALAMLAGWRCLELDRHSITTERSVEWLQALLR